VSLDLKITTQNKTKIQTTVGRMAQAVDCLASMLKALLSISSTAKKNFF
jgi:hypothetical protein